MKLSPLHMFLGGAAIAVTAIVLINVFSNNPSPSSTNQTTATAVAQAAAPEVERSWFQSLFTKDTATSAAPAQPARLAGKPAIKKTPPSSVHIIKVAASNKILTLDLKETTDAESLLPRYPFLEPLAEELHFYKTRPDIFRVPPTLYYAEIVDQKNGNRFFFVRREGSAMCGSGGCSTQIYVDNGAGFLPDAFPLSTTPPIYYRNDPQNGFAFFQCGARNVEEFRFEQGGFKLVDNASLRPADIPGCIAQQTP